MPDESKVNLNSTEFSTSLKLKCPDCGLVQAMVLRGDEIRLQRDNRATGQVRRKREKKNE